MTTITLRAYCRRCGRVNLVEVMNYMPLATGGVLLVTKDNFEPLDRVVVCGCGGKLRLRRLRFEDELRFEGLE